MSLIAQFHAQVQSGLVPTAENMKIVAGEIGLIMRYSEQMGLDATHAQASRVRDMLFNDDFTSAGHWPIFVGAIMEVNSRLIDELEARKCYIVSSERSSYVTGNHFASVVGERFPAVIPDLDEAARCFAFERPTACIFHLMRVTEFALHEIAQLLEIQDHAPNWEPIIRKIDTELKEDYKKRKFKGSQDLLANMSSHLHAVKVAWRNKTMHVEKINTVEHAKEIYDATAGLMRYLAENLPRKEKGIVQSIRDAFGGKN